MSVIRTIHNKENPFVQLNKKALWDSNLSLTAVGLWARCLSRPDNWIFCVKELISNFKEGKKVIYKAINELIEHGYAIKGQKKGLAKDTKKSGKRMVFQPVDYIFFEFQITEKEKIEYSKEFQKSFPLSPFGLPQSELPQKEPLLIAKQANETECLKRATNRDRQQKSPDSPLSNRKMLIASLHQFARNLGFEISERDLGIWVSKYDIDRIKRNMALAKKRKWSNLIKFLESALKNDYAQGAENIEKNRSFLTLFCKENDICPRITKKYATFPGGKEAMFELPPEQFNQILINICRNL